MQRLDLVAWSLTVVLAAFTLLAGGVTPHGATAAAAGCNAPADTNCTHTHPNGDQIQCQVYVASPIPPQQHPLPNNQCIHAPRS